MTLKKNTGVQIGNYPFIPILSGVNFSLEQNLTYITAISGLRSKNLTLKLELVEP